MRLTSFTDYGLRMLMRLSSAPETAFSTAELAEEFGVSQGTMRRALMSVEAMGHLHRKPGRGTIVAEPVAATAAHAPDFTRLTLPDGAPLPLGVFRAGLQSRMPQGTETALFPGRVHALTRTLKSGDDRFALEEVLIAQAVLPEIAEDQPADFVDLLTGLGLAPARIDDRLHAKETSMGESVALACDRHTALLCLTRVARDKVGQVIARQTLRMAGPAAYGVTLGG